MDITLPTVSFPFAPHLDLRPPALLFASAFGGRLSGGFFMCPILDSPYGNPHSFELVKSDFEGLCLSRPPLRLA